VLTLPSKRILLHRDKRFVEGLNKLTLTITIAWESVANGQTAKTPLMVGRNQAEVARPEAGYLVPPIPQSKGSTLEELKNGLRCDSIESTRAGQSGRLRSRAFSAGTKVVIRLGTSPHGSQRHFTSFVSRAGTDDRALADIDPLLLE